MAQPDELVKTTLLILSDTHGAIPEWAIDGSLDVIPDVVIHCGDLTSTGKLDEHRRAFQLLTALPGQIKIVIPGNHDLTLDESYCKSHPRMHGWREHANENDIQDALKIYTEDEAKAGGIVYLVEGSRSLTLVNGAVMNIYANAFTPDFCDWAFAYPRPADRINQKDGAPNFPHKNAIQGNSFPPAIFITHGPPRGVLDATTRGETVGCDELLDSVISCKPLLHCFGHIHEGYGVESWRWDNKPKKWKWPKRQNSNTRQISKPALTADDSCAYVRLDMTDKVSGHDTVFVNASIMTVRYKPVQKPWLVTLNLPKAK